MEKQKMKELAQKSGGKAEELLQLLKRFAVGKNLTEAECEDFINIAQAYQLNPFKREIYAVAFGQGEKRQCSIITGYETYIKRAERTGKLDGWKVEIAGGEADLMAVITIKRKDWKEPFIHEVYYEEAVQKKYINGKFAPTAIWQKMPKFMLKKVAIAQGFRLCFSDELGGMPYTADEYDATANFESENQNYKKAVEMPKEKINVKTEAAAELKQVEVEAAATPEADANGEVIELFPSQAIDVEEGKTIAAVKGFVVSTRAAKTVKGNDCTELIIADNVNSSTHYTLVIFGDETALIKSNRYYIFSDVKVIFKENAKFFYAKKYDVDIAF
jgi:phage recombination protein Bet